MSILLTTSSNVVAVLTVPFVVAHLFSLSAVLTFDPVAMSLRLSQAVLLPLMVGAICRSWSQVRCPRSAHEHRAGWQVLHGIHPSFSILLAPLMRTALARVHLALYYIFTVLHIEPGSVQVRNVVDTNKGTMRNLGTLCLAAVPFTQIGAAKANGSMAQLTPQMLLALGAAVLAALITIRIFNLIVFPCVGALGRPQGCEVPTAITRAVILAANQKTLPISIAVLIQLTDVIGPGVGLATLACVAAHFTQIILDSFLTSWWKKTDQKSLVAKPA
jgi:predicted Na+-dependent transporter